MSDNNKAKLLRKMKRDAHRIIAKVEQMIRDAEWWNTHRPEHPPIDLEPERLLLIEARKDLQCLERGDTIQSAVHSARMVEISEDAVKGIDCISGE